MKRYALKGINDDQHECAVCGRVELKRVMWLAEIDAEGSEISEPFHCGTTCGAKLLGYTQPKMRTIAKNYDSMVAAKRFQMERSHPNQAIVSKLISELNDMQLFGKARIDHPKMKEILQLKKEAKEWADAQEIIITL